MIDCQKLLTAKEAAEHLLVTENSLRSMRSLGLGPPFQKTGHFIRYRRDDLDAYVAALRPSALIRRANKQEQIKKSALTNR